jgi:hypothetical protein
LLLSGTTQKACTLPAYLSVRRCWRADLPCPSDLTPCPPSHRPCSSLARDAGPAEHELLAIKDFGKVKPRPARKRTPRADAQCLGPLPGPCAAPAPSAPEARRATGRRCVPAADPVPATRVQPPDVHARAAGMENWLSDVDRILFNE